jgi:hypothetical protein
VPVLFSISTSIIYVYLRQYVLSCKACQSSPMAGSFLVELVEDAHPQHEQYRSQHEHAVGEVNISRMPVASPQKTVVIHRHYEQHRPQHEPAMGVRYIALWVTQQQRWRHQQQNGQGLNMNLPSPLQQLHGVPGADGAVSAAASHHDRSTSTSSTRSTTSSE